MTKLIQDTRPRFPEDVRFKGWREMNAEIEEGAKLLKTTKSEFARQALRLHLESLGVRQRVAA